jgi:hypothetical protein
MAGRCIIITFKRNKTRIRYYTTANYRKIFFPVYQQMHFHIINRFNPAIVITFDDAPLPL